MPGRIARRDRKLAMSSSVTFGDSWAEGVPADVATATCAPACCGAGACAGKHNACGCLGADVAFAGPASFDGGPCEAGPSEWF